MGKTSNHVYTKYEYLVFLRESWGISPKARESLLFLVIFAWTKHRKHGKFTPTYGSKHHPPTGMGPVDPLQ